ncbi:MAG: nucleotide exchange factor GrpE [Solirubrobacterales bacterium]
MSEDDPVDVPDLESIDPEVPEVPAAIEVPDAPLEAALERPPEPGAAEEFLRRARLAEDRLAEVLKAYRQVRSENDGFRDRITRNIERRFDHRRERLLLKFIDILDNLDRALEAAEQTYTGNPLIEGLILVRTSLLQTLQEEGLERIPVLGLPYDPNFSEAVATEPVDDPEHHHVVMKDMLRGYRLNGKVARASRVVVGEYGAKAPVPEEPEPLIGADEVPPTELGLEPESPAAAEPSLEDLIARLTGKEGSAENTAIAAPLPEVESDLQEAALPEADLPEAEADLPEAEAELLEGDADLREAEPELVEAEADLSDAEEADADLPELEPELVDPVAGDNDSLRAPALFSEDEFTLGEPVEEVAPKKPRAKPRAKPR